MSQKESDKIHSLDEAFAVTSICRADLVHPVVGFSISKAMAVTDEQMRAIAAKLGNNASNQIVKSCLKVIAELVIDEK